MSILSSIARFILIADAKLQGSIGNFFIKRADTARAVAITDKWNADKALTAELATIEKNYRQQQQALLARLESQRLDAQDKAQARRDIEVNDAQDEMQLADSIEDFGAKRLTAKSSINYAVRALEEL